MRLQRPAATVRVETGTVRGFGAARGVLCWGSIRARVSAWPDRPGLVTSRGDDLPCPTDQLGVGHSARARGPRGRAARTIIVAADAVVPARLACSRQLRWTLWSALGRLHDPRASGAACHILHSTRVRVSALARSRTTVLALRWQPGRTACRKADVLRAMPFLLGGAAFTCIAGPRQVGWTAGCARRHVDRHVFEKLSQLALTWSTRTSVSGRVKFDRLA